MNVLHLLDIFSGEIKNINICPGFRVVFRNILSFLINFDRLELYIYHNRRYSFNAQILLVAVNKFLDAKSNAALFTLNLLHEGVVEKEVLLTN